MLDISIVAAEFILEFLEEAQKKGENKEQPVRLSVDDTKACGDLSPQFSYNARFNPDEDTRIEVAGLTLICDLNKLPPPLKSIAVDLSRGPLGNQLVLKSPDLESCGCGKSARIVTKR